MTIWGQAAALSCLMGQDGTCPGQHAQPKDARHERVRRLQISEVTISKFGICAHTMLLMWADAQK